MKNFLSNLILMILPLLILILTVNFYGDAAKLFDKNFEKKITKLILEGNNVTNISNYDERLLQKELISFSSFKPELVVIGSSRTMLINQKHFCGSKFYNNSVSGTSINDIIAIYQLYKSYGKLPKKIILGIDPWLFNQNSDDKRWQSIGEYYYQFSGTNSKFGSSYKYRQLISLSYFQSSLENIPKILKNDEKIIATNRIKNKTNTRLYDGSLVYGKKIRGLSEDEVLEKAMNYTHGEIYRLNNFSSISELKYNEFKKLISDMKLNKISVDIFLAPYHPYVMNKINKNHTIVQEIEDSINKIANSNGIKVYGSFNSENANVDGSHFYDGMHLNEKGLDLILDR